MTHTGLFAIAVVVATAGCFGNNSHPVPDATTSPDGKTSPATCKAEREAALDRACNAPSDCVVVATTDCCGMVKLAVRAGTQAGYPAVEAAYETCLACPPLGCDHADQAEDGMTPMASQSIVAACIANRCTTIVQ